MEHNAYARKFNMAVELKYGGRAGMAVPLFKELVDDGDVKSMLELADCYYDGLGVDANSDTAMKYYEQAAEQGDPCGLLMMGMGYAYGYFGKPDSDKAMEYYQMVVEDYPGDAWYCMGRLYEGIGSWPIDGTKAFHYFELAAGEDDPAAAYKVGECYFTGFGGTKNEQLGMEWMEYAADNLGYVDAMLWLGNHNNFKVIAKARDLNLALAWYEKAAEHNSKLAMLQLGDLYADKRLPCYDVKKATDYFNRVFDMDAENNLCRRYENCPVDNEDDFKFYLRIYSSAAELDLAEGKYLLAQVLDYGRGYRYRGCSSRAVELLESAAAQGHTDAMCALAGHYSEGRGVERNETKAFELVRRAVLAGNVKAYNLMGNFYCKGIGVPVDQKLGYQWYCYAAQCGSDEARFNKAVCLFMGIGVKRNVEEADRIAECLEKKNSALYGATKLKAWADANGFTKSSDGSVLSMEGMRAEQEKKVVNSDVAQECNMSEQNWWQRQMFEFKEWYGGC